MLWIPNAWKFCYISIIIKENLNMLSLNIKNVNTEQSNRLLTYLQWKLNHNSLNIEEIKLARYLDVSVIEAEEILQTLYEQKILKVSITTQCPECFRSYNIKNLDIEKPIECIDCNNEFIPNVNKRLLIYSYVINDKSRYLQNIRPMAKQRQSIITKINKRNDFEMADKKVRVFLSYSHVDEEFKNKLDIHFAPLKRSNKIETWNDRKLVPGTLFDDEIRKHLCEDEIIILLISADFINSDYCYEIEMMKALERMKNSDTIVIPIILRPCLWKETPLKDIQALPKNGTPISKYPDADDAYLEIVQSVNNIIESF